MDCNDFYLKNYDIREKEKISLFFEKCLYNGILFDRSNILYMVVVRII